MQRSAPLHLGGPNGLRGREIDASPRGLKNPAVDRHLPPRQHELLGRVPGPADETRDGSTNGLGFDALNRPQDARARGTRSSTSSSPAEKGELLTQGPPPADETRDGSTNGVGVEFQYGTV